MPGGRKKEINQKKGTEKEPSVMALDTTDLLYFIVEIIKLLVYGHVPLNDGDSLGEMSH